MNYPILNRSITTAFGLLLIILISGFKKDELIKTDLECTVTGVKGNNRQIKGKWKLVKGSTVFYNSRTVDFSCDEVIYYFNLMRL